MDEIQELAKIINNEFGTELAENVKKYRIEFCDPIKLSDSIQARFSVYHHWRTNPDGTKYEPLIRYCWGNPTGAIPVGTFKDINGELRMTPCTDKLLTDMQKLFLEGDSIMYAIDNFGELFTGKIDNGKAPKFIMEGLSKEYIEHYHITEAEVVERINKGTRQIVANMLEDLVINPKSYILAGNPPWLTTLDLEVLDDAKKLLAEYEPETVKKLEQMLPELQKKCPSLQLLQNTSSFAKVINKSQVNIQSAAKPEPVKIQSTGEPWLDDIRRSWGTSKRQASTTIESIPEKLSNQWRVPKSAKTGLFITGAVALTVGAISIFSSHDNEVSADYAKRDLKDSNNMLNPYAMQNIYSSRDKITV